MAFAVCAVVGTAQADYPKPSPYPISWELNFEHSKPKRIVVDVPGQSTPKAYWYLTYTVTNKTDKEQTFLPIFQLVTKEGQVIRSDKNIPAKVFEAIKSREHIKYLEPYTKVAGELRIGDDQAKDSVAIWEEPESKMGTFSIYIGGLSGESVFLKNEKGEQVKDADGKPVILRKTLQLNYQIPGDEIRPGDDPVNEKDTTWVMR
ncbi:MAG TPA: hypothetical protein VL282_01875 [Tepidisphaeraceae bacterium]|jgi:hypothetical protein|nr:hypothetical protein [Tepidisphaeraceae bacterium]